MSKNHNRRAAEKPNKRNGVPRKNGVHHWFARIGEGVTALAMNLAKYGIQAVRIRKDGKGADFSASPDQVRAAEASGVIHSVEPRK